MGLPSKPTLDSVSFLLRHPAELGGLFVRFSWVPVSGLGEQAEVGG